MIRPVYFAEPTLVMKCIRNALLIFNALFTFTGVILIWLGLSVNSFYQEYAVFLATRFFSPTTMIVTTGVLVFFIAMFGIYAAFKLSVALITGYSVLLAFVFVGEISVGISGYILQDQLEDALSNTLNNTLREYPTDIVATNAIDTLQMQLYCCGVRGPTDWSAVIEYDSEGILNLPASCCAFYENDVCIAIKRIGCLSQLEFLISQSSLLLCGTVLTLAVIQVLGVLFAFRLGRLLRQQKTIRDHLKWEVKKQVLNAYVKPALDEMVNEKSKMTNDFGYVI